MKPLTSLASATLASALLAGCATDKLYVNYLVEDAPYFEEHAAEIKKGIHDFYKSYGVHISFPEDTKKLAKNVITITARLEAPNAGYMSQGKGYVVNRDAFAEVEYEDCQGAVSRRRGYIGKTQQLINIYNHEIGHALGLKHSCSSKDPAVVADRNNLMYTRESAWHVRLQPSQVEKIREGLE